MRTAHEAGGEPSEGEEVLARAPPRRTDGVGMWVEELERVGEEEWEEREGSTPFDPQ